jgi:hypothetical protein
MKVWPFGIALRRVVSNRLMLRWLMTVVVSDEEKASFEASGGDREGERKRIIVDVSKAKQVASEPGCGQDLGMSLAGVPFYWPGGVRHVDDASPVCGFRVEQEKAFPETACPGMAGEREYLEAGRP